MQYIAIYHPGPEGTPLNVPLRWQHGATPGVKVLGAWITAIVGGGEGGLENGRTIVLFETDSLMGIRLFVDYMRPYCREIEVRPVQDYLPQILAHESGDPEKYPVVIPGQTAEERQQAIAVFRKYKEAQSPAEAVDIWRNTAGPGGGKATVDSLRVRRELDEV